MKAFSKKFKIFILLVLVLFFGFSSFSFAESEVTWNLSYWLKALFDFIGTIWYILPMIAGKLISNDLLYWTSFWLDVLLWKIWNFSRTFANFLIWFLLIWFIFKYLISVSSNDISVIKTSIPKLAIGAILVNASWFIIAVLIDISTILIAMFWALPQYFYESLDDSAKKLAVPKEIIVEKTTCSPQEKACLPGWLRFNIKDSDKVSIDKFRDYEYQISGPLLFLGHSILDITNSQNKIQHNLFDVDKKKFTHKGEYVTALIQAFIFIMFLIPIFILIIVSIVRIFWVWIYIAFSPLLFLWWIFGFKKMEEASKAFKFSNAIGLIFQPAFVVLAFSLSFVFVLSIADGLKRDSKYTEDVKKTFMMENSDKWIVSISVWQQEALNEFSSWIWWFFGYLIVSLLTIFLIWSMIKISFHSTEVTSWIADRMFKFTEESLKSVTIPTPIGSASVGSLKMLASDIWQIPSRLESSQVERLNKILNAKSDIPQHKFKEFKEKFIDSSNPKDVESILDDVFTTLSSYKDESNIDSRYPNVKALIDSLITKIKSNQELKGVIEDLEKAKDYDEKLGIILKNQETIKSNL